MTTNTRVFDIRVFVQEERTWTLNRAFNFEINSIEPESYYNNKIEVILLKGQGRAVKMHPRTHDYHL